MTFLNALVLVGIISVFLIFGVTLAWADWYSRSGPKSGNVTAIKPSTPDVETERRAA